MEFHRSAFKHDLDRSTILHALENAVLVADLDPEADPPKIPAIGPDFAGNLLEIIWLGLGDGIELIIHAMPLRNSFLPLLTLGSDRP